MPPNIKYKYKYPVTHRWEATNEWSTCSAVCNGRIRKKVRAWLLEVTFCIFYMVLTTAWRGFT